MTAEKTFERAISLQANDAVGARGWPALALEARGRRLLLLDGARRRHGRNGLHSLASRVSWQLSRHGVRRVSRPRRVVFGARPRQRRWLDEVVNGRRVAAARAVIVKAANQVTFGDAVVIDQQDQAVYPALAETSSGVAAAWTAGTDPSVGRVRILPVP